MKERYAIITHNRSAYDTVEDVERTISAYLPAGYKVAACDGTIIVIRGEDDCGWTLEDYVLPRLASGLYFGEEVGAREAGLQGYKIDNQRTTTR